MGAVEFGGEGWAEVVQAHEGDDVGEVLGAEDGGQAAAEFHVDQVGEADGDYGFDFDQLGRGAAELLFGDELNRDNVAAEFAADGVEFVVGGEQHIAGAVQRGRDEHIHVERGTQMAVQANGDAADDGAADAGFFQQSGHIAGGFEDRAVTFRQTPRCLS